MNSSSAWAKPSRIRRKTLSQKDSSSVAWGRAQWGPLLVCRWEELSSGLQQLEVSWPWWNPPVILRLRRQSWADLWPASLTKAANYLVANAFNPGT